jgi:hypothetical protein
MRYSARQVLIAGITLVQLRQARERFHIEIARAAIVRLQRQPSAGGAVSLVPPAPVPTASPVHLAQSPAAGLAQSLSSLDSALSAQHSPSGGSVLSGGAAVASGAADDGAAAAAGGAGFDSAASAAESVSSATDSPAASLRSRPRLPLLSGLSDEELMVAPRALAARMPRCVWLEGAVAVRAVRLPPLLVSCCRQRADRAYRSVLRGYTAAVRGARPLSRTEWLRRLRVLATQVAAEAAAGSSSYFVEVGAVQARFDALLADERVPEGRRFWMLLDGMQSGALHWEPADVVMFVEVRAPLGRSVGRSEGER